MNVKMNSLLKKIILIISVATLVLQLAGFVSPWWSVYEYHFTVTAAGFFSNTESLGLWYGIYCDYVEGELQCTTYSHDAYIAHISQRFVTNGAFLELAHNQWIDVSIEATCSLLACLVGLVSVFQFRPSQESLFKMWILIAGIAFLLSGVLIWVSVGELIDVYRGNAVVEKLTGAFESKTPYSLLLSGSGGVTAFIVVLLLMKVWYDKEHGLRTTSLADNPTTNVQMQTFGEDTGPYINPIMYPIAPPSYQPPSYTSNMRGTRSESPPHYEVLSNTSRSWPQKAKW